MNTKILAAELGVSHEQAFVAVEQTGLLFTQLGERHEGYPVLEFDNDLAELVRARIGAFRESRKVYRSTPEQFRGDCDVPYLRD